ncbi:MULTISPECIES: malate:quinone oxidoreductase [Komagataeibacter]|uniref:Probable malate:quinone oxidoreductase n=2 Tax=Komagataeibacter TaxID=1434011 RepID=A0A0D6QBJ5_KOMXY|nr:MULTISPECIES: malate:quinone oxidoreductase [Komagataeibacter]MBL7234083.1 malate:quinone oxidoreductase [Komagataeibacter oboediens]MBT0673960.1 malate:quinone oxidoreductase [Komagataeibacter oboediens]MBT0677317.1 malate:quinone oxidoreductase [Komagataeibacter oboediens]MBV0889236.1 malate:quinone oxidoreductase [Komagataeibacter oboediens]MCK9819379.1 malate:quinone oxidoreductase [Komagataeibacter oboediens]
MTSNPSSAASTYDVVLIGGGIMSATLGALLRQLEPGLSIGLFGRLDDVALESSNGWNNAGTGHSALCELNYTPLRPDGVVDISKAVNVNEAFQVSRQFWSYLVETGQIASPRDFLNPIPHMSFVWGPENVDFLRRRHAALQEHPLFAGMSLSTDEGQLRQWMPLVMQDRKPGQPLAATWHPAGTDVNFGALTHRLISLLQGKPGFDLNLAHEVEDLKPAGNNEWDVSVRAVHGGGERRVRAKFVFIGAGGGALHLLQKSGIPEARGIGGFPVSGQFLRCTNPEVVQQHHAKVYGKASVGAPPMSVPHLDTRVIDGQRGLLFGPYAGFSTKFLKQGSWLDLPRSIRMDNIGAMLAVARDNMPLTKYLIQQVMQSSEDRLKALRDFVPTARKEDWELITAGQRVQVIKKDAKRGGVLQFGTEVVTGAGGSIAGLLGASPGASTAAPIMLTVLQRCFGGRLPQWESRLREMIPSYGVKLGQDAALCAQVRDRTRAALQLDG